MDNSQTSTQVYLWVVGDQINLPNSELIAGRYEVITPNIWLDTQPQVELLLPENFSDDLIPYFKLFPHSLHLPYLYTILNFQEKDYILLENAPITPNGELYPSLEEAWSQATEVRQLYWLWQIWELWSILKDFNLVKSLLIPENIRVQGWRVRLTQLYQDESSEESLITQLAHNWEKLLGFTKSSFTLPLSDLIKTLQTEDINYQQIGKNLNDLLLEVASIQPLQVKIASGTALGTQPTHNEDSYYPRSEDLPSQYNEIVSVIASQLMIVCDGIEGHEGGEVASQLAISTIKLQIQALLREIAQEPEIMTPDLVKEQLGAIIRIANNMIAARNDQQGREGRKRMGTTLVMALQLPQLIGKAESVGGNSHELYIAHVGDSRAYWLTSQKCEKLTIDHDLTTREVKLGHSTYQLALKNPNGSALTQALGTKEGDQIKPTIQRFIIEEDGILLLCSDGLSDYNFLEKNWQKFANEMLLEKRPLEDIVESLLVEGTAYNGHDNLSVVVAVYRVHNQPPILVNLEEFRPEINKIFVPSSAEFTSQLREKSQGLVLFSPVEKGEILADHTINAEIISEEKIKASSESKKWLKMGSKIIFVSLGSIGLLLLMGLIIIVIQWLINPQQIEQWREQIFEQNSTEKIEQNQNRAT